MNEEKPVDMFLSYEWKWLSYLLTQKITLNPKTKYLIQQLTSDLSLLGRGFLGGIIIGNNNMPTTSTTTAPEDEDEEEAP